MSRLSELRYGDLDVVVFHLGEGNGLTDVDMCAAMLNLAERVARLEDERDERLRALVAEVRSYYPAQWAGSPPDAVKAVERALVALEQVQAARERSDLVLSLERQARLLSEEALKQRAEAAEKERDRLREEVEGLWAFKRSVDEALNSGDGSYRP